MMLRSIVYKMLSQFVTAVYDEIWGLPRWLLSLSCVQLFATPWTVARQAFWSFTVSQSLLKLMSAESMMPSDHLCHFFSCCFQSFPASGSFPVSQLFASGGQRIRASASAPALPMNIQGWLPLGLTGWISLLSEGLSKVFSSTTN